MPVFGSPFSGLANDRKLGDEELIRAIRFMVAAEYEAVQLYMQLAESTDNKLAVEVLKDIADEERVHAGEFLRLLRELAPDEEKFYAEGAKEVEGEIGKNEAKDSMATAFIGDCAAPTGIELFPQAANEVRFELWPPLITCRSRPASQAMKPAAGSRSSVQTPCPTRPLHPLRRALTKFWAPVPWMLEAAIVLEIVLGKYVEAAIIAVLLAFNAALGFFQEGRAQATLAALKSRLALNASVRRDNVWATVPAAGLVPGDIVKLSVGAVVAADVRLTEGEILLDQSMLTGESVPIEAGARLRNLCRGAGAARRSGCGGHGDRSAHKVWTHRGTGSHRARRKFPAEGRSARGAQSRHVQWRHHRDAGRVRPRSQDAAG